MGVDRLTIPSLSHYVTCKTNSLSCFNLLDKLLSYSTENTMIEEEGKKISFSPYLAFIINCSQYITNSLWPEQQLRFEWEWMGHFDIIYPFLDRWSYDKFSTPYSIFWILCFFHSTNWKQPILVYIWLLQLIWSNSCLLKWDCPVDNSVTNEYSPSSNLWKFVGDFFAFSSFS